MKLSPKMQAVLDTADGKRSSEDIAKAIGSTPSSVHTMIYALRRMGHEVPMQAAVKPRPFERVHVPVVRQMPEKPRLTATGEYDPKSLSAYFAKCRREKITDAEMAKHLGVDLHRIVWFTRGEGAAILRRRAA